MTVRWTEEIIIQSDDVDFRSECRWSVMLGFMQRAADTHIEKLGVGRDQMLEQGLGWMLITMDMTVEKMPQYADAIHITTWSRGAKGALWNRDYRFTDRTGKEFGSARSVWALVDIHKRKILRPSAFPYEVPVHMESAGSPPDKAVIPEGTALREAYAYTVRYSGIDSNGHLNNARYADLCFDVLEANELRTGRAAGLKITYHREARMGDEIKLRRSYGEGDTIYVQGVSPEGTNFFEAAVVMTS